MRIAFVLNNLSGGGAERVAVTLANEFATAGHDVSIVLNHKRGPYLDDVSSSIEVAELGRRMLFAIPRLVWMLRQRSFDVVLPVLDQPAIACLLTTAMVPNTRVIVIECNNPLASDAEVRGIVWKAVRRLRFFLYPKADHIVTKSERNRRALIDHFGCMPTNVSSISNPLDVSRIVALASHPLDHPWFGVHRNAPVIVSMGRLVGQKGFDTLMRAFALVLRDRPANLLLLGEGPDRQVLETLVEELGLGQYISMPGFVSNPYPYLRQSDLFVMSSRWEGWPNALVESLACGASVVSTDCDSGPAEILLGGKFGRLVPVDDEVALASAMIEALATPLDTMDISAHISALSPERVAARYVSVFTRALQ